MPPGVEEGKQNTVEEDLEVNQDAAVEAAPEPTAATEQNEKAMEEAMLDEPEAEAAASPAGTIILVTRCTRV